MRVVSAAILATTMLVSSAFAADNASLAPGKPAGVKQAQQAAPWIGPALLGGAIVGIIVYAAIYRDNNNQGGGNFTTTTTSP
jgi:hypothetical protein